MGWPPERRKAQAERIKKQKPWQHATGPKTAAGKAKSAQNAYKHGFRSRDYLEICRLLRWQRDFVKNIVAQLKNGTYNKSDVSPSPPSPVIPRLVRGIHSSTTNTAAFPTERWITRPLVRRSPGEGRTGQAMTVKREKHPTLYKTTQKIRPLWVQMWFFFKRFLTGMIVSLDELEGIPALLHNGENPRKGEPP